MARQPAPPDDPDDNTGIYSTTSRLCKWRDPDYYPAAVDAVRQQARGRADLLAETAGIHLGFGTTHARESSEADWKEVAAWLRLLVTAGADVTAIPGWAVVGRARIPIYKFSYPENWLPIPDFSPMLTDPPIPDAGVLADYPDRWRRLIVHPILTAAERERLGPIVRAAVDAARGSRVHSADLVSGGDRWRIRYGMRLRDSELAEAVLSAAAEQIRPQLGEHTVVTVC